MIVIGSTEDEMFQPLTLKKKKNSRRFPVTRDSLKPGVRLLEVCVQQEPGSLQLF